MARGSNLPEDDLAALLFEAGFRELVDCCAGILAMSREARLARMERIAGEIIDDALTRRDPVAAMFVLRQRQTRRDPIATLARGFCKNFERERAKAQRLNAEIDAGRLTPDTPAALPAPPPAPEPTPTDPMAQALAAEAMRPDRHPDPMDRALWRKASALRQKMLDEQVLHHAVEAERQRELRQLPAEPHAVQQLAGLLPLAPDAILTRDELQALAEDSADVPRAARGAAVADLRHPAKRDGKNLRRAGLRERAGRMAKRPLADERMGRGKAKPSPTFSCLSPLRP